jgi:transposase-like protein
MATQPRITICPPGPQTEHFDDVQFDMRHPHAVSARYTPTGWDSTGLSFNDYSRCHVTKRSNKGSKHRPIPQWALDDAKTKEVIIRYLEYRNYLPAATDKSYEERLATVNAAATKRIQEFTDNLKRFYRNGTGDTEIQNMDTKIVLERKGMHALVAAVVYFSYRLNYDSPSVYKETGVKPPHVRIILWRCNKIAKEIEQGLPHRKNQKNYRHDHSQETVDAIREARKYGDTWAEIAEAMGIKCAYQSYGQYTADIRPLVRRRRRPVVRRRKWTPEVIAKVEICLELGLSYKRIAKRLGVETQLLRAAVWSKRKAAGEVNGPRRRIWTEDLLSQIERLHCEGLTYKAIAKKLKVNPHTLTFVVFYYKRKAAATSVSRDKAATRQAEGPGRMPQGAAHTV